MMMTMPPTKQYRNRLFVVSIIALSTSTVTAFIGAASSRRRDARKCPTSPIFAGQLSSTRRRSSPSSSTSTVLFASSAVDDVKLIIEESIRNTDRGRSVRHHELTQINTHISNLESLCTLSEPARDVRMGGAWEVLYTDAPPPSNGQLGLFKGVAMQVIDLKNRRYRNELYVGDNTKNGDGVGDDNGAWLTAVLDAEWSEWDGVYLDSSSLQQHQQQRIDTVDPGATTWKVTFASITFTLFKVPIFTKTFDSNTSRTWKMTYLDDETRIVRAGRTGRGDHDYVFYMKRR